MKSVLGFVLAILVPAFAHAAASVSVSPTTATPGQQLTITFSGGPGNVTDWWDIIAVPSNNESSWGYMGGTMQRPATGLSGGSFTVTAPGTVGNYTIRYMTQSYALLASTPLVVGASAPPPPPSSSGGVSSLKCTGSVQCSASTGDVTITGTELSYSTPAAGSACNVGQSFFATDRSQNPPAVYFFLCDNGHYLKVNTTGAAY